MVEWDIMYLVCIDGYFLNVSFELGGEAIKSVTTFTYIGSMFDAKGGPTTDCKSRVRLAWSK